MSSLKHEALTDSIQMILLDGDVLVYEQAFGAEYKDDQGEHQVRSWEYLEENIDRFLEYLKLRLDCTDVKIYLTGTGNFRFDVAKSQEYKAARSDKPFHYKAIRDWLIHFKGATVVDGMEADDALSIEQVKAQANGVVTCIASRDKDLMMVPGWHYCWEVHNQPEKLCKATKLGTLSLGTASKKKLTGDGLKWFYAQCIMGDRTDTIPGLPKCGDVLAFNTLQECSTEQEMFTAVRELYHAKGFDDEYLLEQGQLLWMVQELNQDGTPVMWKFPCNPS